MSTNIVKELLDKAEARIRNANTVLNSLKGIINNDNIILLEVDDAASQIVTHLDYARSHIYEIDRMTMLGGKALSYLESKRLAELKDLRRDTCIEFNSLTIYVRRLVRAE